MFHYSENGNKRYEIVSKIVNGREKHMVWCEYRDKENEKAYWNDSDYCKSFDNELSSAMIHGERYLKS